MIQRGEVWWAELAEPRGAGPGFRLPVVVLQSDGFNWSRMATVVVAAITSKLELAAAPGDMRLSRREGGLPRESAVNVSQLLTLDRRLLTGRAGRLPASALREVEVRLVLSL